MTAGDQYLSGFRQDLTGDLEMLRDQLEARQDQPRDALTTIEFFEGRPIEPQMFFEAYWSVPYELRTAPNRNTMDEVLSSGSLRLIRDPTIRAGLLRLYVTYHRIARLEEHMARDFDSYLYDPTFSSIPIQIEGPWEDTPPGGGQPRSCGERAPSRTRTGPVPGRAAITADPLDMKRAMTRQGGLQDVEG